MNMPGLCYHLEDLFLLVFPEDSLIGKNHRSLPDTHMPAEDDIPIFLASPSEVRRQKG